MLFVVVVSVDDMKFGLYFAHSKRIMFRVAPNHVNEIIFNLLKLIDQGIFVEENHSKDNHIQFRERVGEI